MSHTPDTQLSPATSALVLIDLQKHIVSRDLGPRSGPEAVANAVVLLSTARAAGIFVVLVRVGFRDALDRPGQAVDQPMPGGGALPPDWLDFTPEVVPESSDLLVTKRQWGAVYGTELDLQLRRRGIKTVLLGGIATNIGVESTARDLWELGYDLMFAEDAMSSRTGPMHDFAVKTIFPLIGKVRSTAELLKLFPESKPVESA